jgi:hypothetical protein
MPIIERAELRFTQGTSDKVYVVAIEQREVTTSLGASSMFVVHTAYGRYGRVSNRSENSAHSTRWYAQRVTDRIVSSKIRKGYLRQDGCGGRCFGTLEPDAINTWERQWTAQRTATMATQNMADRMDDDLVGRIIGTVRTNYVPPQPPDPLPSPRFEQRQRVVPESVHPVVVPFNGVPRGRDAFGNIMTEDEDDA